LPHHNWFKVFKSSLAADCSAFFFDEPFENINFVFLSLTPTLKLGLCLGPVLEITL